MENSKEKSKEKLQEQLKDKLKETSNEEAKEGVKEEEIKDTLRGLLGEITNLKKDRDILMQSADKRALARYYSRHREDLPPIVRLRTINGKIIVGWRMIEDKGSYQVPGTGRWTESQTIEIIYQDGTSTKMAEMDFERMYEKTIKAKVISVTIDNTTKQEVLELQRLDNGENLTIGVAYIN